METWEGMQFFNEADAKKFILHRKLKKRALINKDVKHAWFGDDWKDVKHAWFGDDWKQTYTVQKTSKQGKNVKKAIRELLK